MAKKIVLIVLIILATAIAFAGFWYWQKNNQERPIRQSEEINR